MAQANKTKLLEELHQQYDLKTCPVNTHACTQLVWGEGNPNAQLMFIGEAPGQEEDKLGHPFIGRSGKLLTQCLNNIGIQREDVFITNIVKCRPPNNRKPLLKEINFYKPILLDEIKIVHPKVICTLGTSAIEALIDQKLSITKTHGNPLLLGSITLIPTFHPAYILRNPSTKQTFINDIATAYEYAKIYSKQ